MRLLLVLCLPESVTQNSVAGLSSLVIQRLLHDGVYLMGLLGAVAVLVLVGVLVVLVLLFFIVVLIVVTHVPLLLLLLLVIVPLVVPHLSRICPASPIPTHPPTKIGMVC